MARWRIKINPEGTLHFHYVGGNSLDEAHNEAVRWVNNNKHIRKARFIVIPPTVAP